MPIKRSTTNEGIYVPTEGNPLLEKALAVINQNKEVRTLWYIVNVNAIGRHALTDHGPVHSQIVANSALRLTRILLENNVQMSITKNFDLSPQYAELVVLLTSLFHDLGMSVDREAHEEYSLFLAYSLLRETLHFLPIDERTIVIAETLHAIIAHRNTGRPITVEAGIVRVADALDMSKGRSRIPYKTGKVDIHSLSAAAIENVEIIEGGKKPIQINVTMNNSAGIFQVDELLKNKLIGSGIEEYVAVKAFIRRRNEKSLLKEFGLNGL